MNERQPFLAKPLRWIVITAIAAIGLGGLLVWGFIEGRGEATAEAQREQPVKAAVQVSHNNAGAPVITLSPDLQQQADIQLEHPNAAPYQQQVQAYGSVLDLQPFTDLGNTIANAKAQLAIAEAKLAASQAAFQRAQVLHKDGQNFSTAQLQAAEATYQSDAASVRAAQVQTQNAAASAYQAWGRFSVCRSRTARCSLKTSSSINGFWSRSRCPGKSRSRRRLRRHRSRPLLDNASASNSSLRQPVPIPKSRA